MHAMGLALTPAVISTGNPETKIGIMGKKIFFPVNATSADLKRNFYSRADVLSHRPTSC